MTPFWTSDNGQTTLRLYRGDVREVLRQMPAESVHCNKRTVWEIATEPTDWDYCLSCGTLFTGERRSKIFTIEEGDKKKKRLCPICGHTNAWIDHFATFPEALIEPCILAGTSEKGCCPECGAPWERVTETTYQNDTTISGRPAQGNNVKGGEEQGARTFASGVRTRRIDTTLGWHPTCAHGLDPVPCTCADPFAGSATTLLVAQRLGRNGIGIELKPEYCEMARKRLESEHAQMRLELT